MPRRTHPIGDTWVAGALWSTEEIITMSRIWPLVDAGRGRSGAIDQVAHAVFL
ncbi:MAG: hypothetical protein O7B77_03625 [Actinobacteria bacterium]|nr:hypothetical protein [Actinomycetota bacterium]